MKRLCLWGVVAALGAASVSGLFNHPHLPSTLKVDSIIASDEVGGLTEGCGAFYYRLSAETVGHLRQEGIGFLERGPKPLRPSLGISYGPWIETPGRIDLDANGNGGSDATIYGLYSLDGCGASNETLRAEARGMREALEKPGSYFSITANREAIVVVAPRRRTAAFLYFG